MFIAPRDKILRSSFRSGTSSGGDQSTFETCRSYGAGHCIESSSYKHHAPTELKNQLNLGIPDWRRRLRVPTFRESKQAPSPETQTSGRNGDEKENRLSDDVRPFHDNPQEMRQGEQRKDRAGSHDICLQ
jgi:hypothetical protein